VIVRQTLALFLDAYREMNARKLFWVSLVLSGIVVAAFAMVGLSDRGITLLWFEFRSNFNARLISPDMFYKYVYGVYGVGWWLNWIGVALALVTTGGIFPEFIAGGSVDLYLSKPVSRVRLFLTKYVSGLLFAALQVAVFSAACFVCVGVRTGSWDVKFFLAIPVTVLVFSYLSAVCVLLGVLTRSTVAATLLTLLFWMLAFAIRTTVGGLTTAEVAGRIERRAYEAKHANLDRQIATLEQRVAAGEAPAKASLETVRRQRVDSEARRVASEPARENVDTAVAVFRAIYAGLPKPADTGGLLVRWMNVDTTSVDEEQLRKIDERNAAAAAARDSMMLGGLRDRTDVGLRDSEVLREATRVMRGNSTGWVIGTSLVFEAVVLGLACWVFCRRDY